ncbi:MAG: PAS domain S-box protein [Deltaproteobacteria bacterium]|nr:PAS domain S-box protein [Deltaproteobacteria bacterium]
MKNDIKTNDTKQKNGYKKIIIISPDYRILYASSHAVKDGKTDILGTKCHEALFDRKSPCEYCLAGQVIKTRKPAVMRRDDDDNETNSKKGSCVYTYPILSGEKTDALLMLDFDLPAMEKMEEKLQRSNAFLKNLILSSVDGVIAADKTGKILIFNDAAEEVSGYSIEEALSTLNIRDVYPGEGAKNIMRKLRDEKYGGKGKLKSHKVDVQRKSGETIPICLSAAIVYEGEHEVASIGFFHDLREKIKMEEELKKTQLQLVQAEKMVSLGKLAAGVAHQLNNPLGGITLFAQLIMEEYKLEDGAREDLSRIIKDAQRCRDTVKELLEFARQTKLEKKPLDINRTISRTLFLLGNQTLFHNIVITQDVDSSLPQIPADIQQINHVIMNIILNAAQAMEGHGELLVKTGLAPETESVFIEIADTGPGIAEDIIGNIFEPFYTTKEEGKGTGLGLSLVYGIVKDHSGTVTAANRHDKGAVFRIELPLKQPENGGNKSDG